MDRRGLDEYDDDEEAIQETEGRGAMGFLDHLEDLRWTLFKCLAAFLVSVVGVGIFLKAFSAFLNWPLHRAMAESAMEGQGLFMTSPMGVFSVLIQVCFLGGLGLSLPFILFFLAQFIAPALKRNEMAMLLPSCVAAFFLFLGGAAFSYLFIVPEALKFSIRLNQMLGFEILWSADRYYSLLVWTILGMGFCFQFPLLVYVLVYLRVVTTAKLRAARPYMIVLFFFLGALLTPTWDPVTQTMVALPMWILFEISLFFARKLEARRMREIERALAEAEENEP
jgi:sec-independent protein translocase protein TatC